MSKDKTTAIVKVEAKDYAILKVDPDRRRELIRQNVGTAGVSEFDLDRAKIPSGGVTMFEVPSLEGSDFVDSVEGVVVGWRDVRVYWEHAYGEGEAGPPDCVSDNSHGSGTPGGDCAMCPMAQFGSDPREKSKGQACQQRRVLMLMRSGSLLPLIISLPPTSVKDARKFFLRLLNSDKSPYEVVVSIGLVQDTNAGGIPYAKATFKVVDQLSPELAAQFDEIRDSFGPQLKAAVKTEAATVNVVGPDERKRATEEETKRNLQYQSERLPTTP